MEIDRDHPPAGDARVLDRHVPEAPDPKDGDEIRGSRPRDLDRLVGRDSGASERRCIEGVDPIGDLDDVARVRGRVLAEAAVDRVPHVLLLEAEGLPAGDAVVARAAGVAEPGHRNTIADPDLGDARTELLHDPDAFVTGNERRGGLHRPVAVCGVDVRVTETRRLDLHSDLTRCERATRNLLDAERLRKVMHNRRAVGGGGAPRRRRLHLSCGHYGPPSVWYHQYSTGGPVAASWPARNALGSSPQSATALLASESAHREQDDAHHRRGGQCRNGQKGRPPRQE